MRSRDPYDREQVLDACARHSWQEHAEQFKQHGINSEPELRTHIEKTIERQDASTFRCQPQPERGQTVPREVYNAPLRSEASGKSYETSVILNPNRDAQGQVYGGTCTIVNIKKGEFERLARQEHDATGERPRIVIGGREALREQERHQQVEAYREQPQRFDPKARREAARRQSQEEIQRQRKAQEPEHTRGRSR